MSEKSATFTGKKLIRFIALVLFLATETIIAGPANPDPFDVRQPDGTAITIQVSGDEFFHSYETVDGYTILKNRENWWVYAEKKTDGSLEPSDVRVSPENVRSAKESSFKEENIPRLRPSAEELKSVILMRRQFSEQIRKIQAVNQAQGGIRATWKLCVLLVDFTDSVHKYQASDFADEFNKQGFNNNGIGPGCLGEYFTEVSYGKFSVTADVFGWYKDTKDMGYYAHGGPDPWGRSRELFERTVTAADADVDFSKYDNNGDGVVEGIIILHAGRGASEDGNMAFIWNHMFWVDPPITKDGVKLKNYTLDNELEYGSQAGLGNLAHEYGHVLGMPDLYGTPTVGNWCVMATGAWCNRGKTPPHFCAYIKKKLDWSTPTRITSNGNYTFKQVTSDNCIYRCNAYNSIEYFLLENRQRTSWDKYLPGSGILIFHVDSSKEKMPWDFGGGTNSPAVIEEADGLFNVGSNRGDAGDPYPGSTKNRTFDANSRPNNYLLNGSAPTYVTVSNVSDTLAAMTAYVTVSGGASVQAYASPLLVTPYYGGLDTIVHDKCNTKADWFAGSGSGAGGRLGQRMTPRTNAAGTIIAIQVYNPVKMQSYKVGVWQWSGSKPGPVMYESDPITSISEGWKSCYIQNSSVKVTGDFFLGFTCHQASTVLGAGSANNDRSFWQGAGANEWNAWTYSLCLRAIIDYSGVLDTVRSFSLGNMGSGGSLNVSSIAGSQSWIKTITPSNPTVAAGSAKDVSVTVSRAGLADGIYNDTLTVTSNDAPYKVPVRFTLRTGEISVVKLGLMPDTLRPYYHGTENLGPYIKDTSAANRWESKDNKNTMGQRLTSYGPCKVTAIYVYNVGTHENKYRLGVCGSTNGTLDTAAIYQSDLQTSTSEGWSMIDLSSQNVNLNGEFIVTWLGDNDGITSLLASRNDNGRSYWRGPGGGWTQWTYGFYLKAIVKYDSYIDTLKTITVTNEGIKSSLIVSSITADRPWVTTINTSSFTLAGGETKSVQVAVSRRGLGSGAYQGLITIASNDQASPSIKTPIKFTLENVVDVSISVAPEPLHFSYDVPVDTVKTLVVTNTGGSKDLSVSDITADQPWIVSIDPKSFSVAPGASRTVTVTASGRNIPEQLHSAKLTITNNSQFDKHEVAATFNTFFADRNIALYKPSIALSGTTAANVNDSLRNTRWTSVTGIDTQWIRIDLQKLYDVKKAVIYWHSAAAKSYRVQVSVDTTGWKDVFSTADGNGGTDTITFTPAQARYVRLFCTVRLTTSGYSVYELEVYGDRSGTNEIVVNSAIPKSQSLVPFNNLAGGTIVRYALPRDGNVSLLVYNLRGERVRTLVQQAHKAGTYSIHWNRTNDQGSKLARGLYLLRLNSPAGRIVRRLMVMK